MIGIRQPTIADKKGLISLACIWPNGSLLVPIHEERCTAEGRPIPLLDDPNWCIRVAIDHEAKDTVVGYAIATRHNHLGILIAELEEIFVSWDCQRKGIGSLLVQAFEAWAQLAECGKCIIGGGPAPEFYESLGYQRHKPLMCSFEKILR